MYFLREQLSFLGGELEQKLYLRHGNFIVCVYVRARVCVCVSICLCVFVWVGVSMSVFGDRGADRRR